MSHRTFGQAARCRPCHRLPRRTVAALAAAALGGVGLPPVGAAGITGLGNQVGQVILVDPYSPVPTSFVGVDGSGTVVVKALGGSFGWTAANAWQPLSVPGWVAGIAGDGTIFGLSAPGSPGPVFSLAPGQAVQYPTFPHLPQLADSAFSADGSRIVGQDNGTGAWFIADHGGVQVLPAAQGVTLVSPLSVSGNGGVAAFNGLNQQGQAVALTWQGSPGSGSFVTLGSGRADAMSADGSVVVGRAGAQGAVVWNQGTPTYLGTLGGTGISYPNPYSSPSEALAVTADGRTVVGTAADRNNIATAFIWQASGGSMQSFSDYLAARGVAMADWTLFSVNSISADGRHATGLGSFKSGAEQIWQADLYATLYWRQGQTGPLGGYFGNQVGVWTDVNGLPAKPTVPSSIDDVVFANAGAGSPYDISLGNSSVYGLTVAAGIPVLQGGSLQAHHVDVLAGAQLQVDSDWPTFLQTSMLTVQGTLVQFENYPLQSQPGIAVGSLLEVKTGGQVQAQGWISAGNVVVDDGASWLQLPGVSLTTAGAITVQGSGSLQLLGGSLQVGSAGSPGNFVLQGSPAALASVVHTGGSLQVAGDLRLNQGSYLMNTVWPYDTPPPTLSAYNLVLQAGSRFEQHQGRTQIAGAVNVDSSSVGLFDGAQFSAQQIVLAASGALDTRGAQVQAQTLSVAPGASLSLRAGNYIDDSGRLWGTSMLSVPGGIVNSGSMLVSGLPDPNGGPYLFDPNSTALMLQADVDNRGSLTINGRGDAAALRWTGALSNSGTLAFGGPGNLNFVMVGNLHNTASGQITVALTPDLTTTLNIAQVVNDGSIKVYGGGNAEHHGTVVWSSGVLGNGAYVSDPATNVFGNLTIGSQGYLQGGLGDAFLVTGDLTSSSTSSQWQVAQALLGFTGGHHHTYTANSNVHWGVLSLAAGDPLTLQGSGITFTFDTVQGVNDEASLLSLLSGVGSFDLVITSAFGGGPLTLTSDQLNAEPVPEPGAGALMLAGLAGLYLLRRRPGPWPARRTTRPATAG